MKSQGWSITKDNIQVDYQLKKELILNEYTYIHATVNIVQHK